MHRIFNIYFGIAIVILIIASPMQAQGAVLKGQVRKNELSGPAVSGVKIDTVGHLANSKVTDTSGQFSLKFSTKGPGEPVQLIVSKKGYVVVNDIQLKLSLPMNPDDEPLIIIICAEKERPNLARRFYRIKSFEAIEEAYKIRIEKLTAENQATKETLSKLRTERDQAKAIAEKAAEEYARMDLSKSSELYSKAMSLFLKNQVSEALKVLDEEKLHNTIEEARQQQKKANKAIDEAIKAYLLKARLLTTQFRFKEAENIYIKAVELEPDSLEANFSLAYFYSSLNKRDKALLAYKLALELAQKKDNKLFIAMILNNLGNIYFSKNCPKEALEEYRKAVNIFEFLVKDKTSSYLPYLPSALIGLGHAFRELDNLDKALEAYNRALKMFQSLAKDNPEIFLPDVSGALSSLAILYTKQNRFDEASKALENSLEISRKLMQQKQETHSPDLAMILFNKGVLYSSQNRFDDAQQAFNEALANYRQLVKENPDKYLPSLMKTFSGLGVLYEKQDRFDDAQQAFNEALANCSQLVKENPEEYTPYGLDLLDNIGDLLYKQRRFNDAQQTFNDILAHYRNLAIKKPEVYLPNVAKTLKKLGIIFFQQNRIDDGLKVLNEALGIYKQLVETNYTKYNEDVIRINEMIKLAKEKNANH